MKEAVLSLQMEPDYLLIDGSHRIFVHIPQETIVKGDSRSISVASASIIAKESRDRIMEIYHRQFPKYNFLKIYSFFIKTDTKRSKTKDKNLCKDAGAEKAC
jgi:ribonuclease HII